MITFYLDDSFRIHVVIENITRYAHHSKMSSIPFFHLEPRKSVIHVTLLLVCTARTLTDSS